MGKYYDYDHLLSDVNCVDNPKLWKSTVRCINIGCSVLSRPIYAFIIGENKPSILIQGGMHAREHIGGALISYLMHNLKTSDVSFIFIPLLNVDGVELSLYGLDSISNYNKADITACPPYHNNYDKNLSVNNDYMRKSAYQNYILNDNASINERKKLLFFINGSNDFCMWKANANAVDLNVNWDANFSKGASNINFPASENYIGKFPFSEKENRILRDLVLKNDIKAAISYHSKGNTIYWDYENKNIYQKEAIEASKILGYELQKAENSHGGFKDWFIQKFNKFALTIEIGEDKYTYLEQYDYLDSYKEKHLEFMNFLKSMIL